MNHIHDALHESNFPWNTLRNAVTLIRAVQVATPISGSIVPKGKEVSIH